MEWSNCRLDFSYKFSENIVMNLIVDDGSKEKHQRKVKFIQS